MSLQGPAGACILVASTLQFMYFQYLSIVVHKQFIYIYNIYNIYMHMIQNYLGTPQLVDFALSAGV